MDHIGIAINPSKDPEGIIVNLSTTEIKKKYLKMQI